MFFRLNSFYGGQQFITEKKMKVVSEENKHLNSSNKRQFLFFSFFTCFKTQHSKSHNYYYSSPQPIIVVVFLLRKICFPYFACDEKIIIITFMAQHKHNNNPVMNFSHTYSSSYTQTGDCSLFVDFLMLIQINAKKRWNIFQ